MGRGYELRVVALLSINFGLVFLDRNALNYLMPFVSGELGLDNSQIGLLAGATAFSWALSGLAFGMIADRFGGTRRIIIIATIIFSLCSVLSGLAAGFVALLLIRLIMGVAEGPVLPLSQAIVAQESPPERRGFNMGVINNLGSNLLGVLIAPLVLVALASAYGWRTAFWVTGIPGLVMAVLIWRFVRDPGRPTLADDTSSSLNWRELLRIPNLWLCMAIACCMLAWTLLGWAFLPLYMTKILHFTPGMMSILMAVLGASAVLCSMVVPGLSDRIGRKPVMIVFCAIGIVVPLVMWQFTLPPIWLAIIMFLGWSASGTLPLFMAVIPAESVPRYALATALALVMGTGEIIGGTIGPIVAGALADIWGLVAPLVLQIGCALLAAFLSFFLHETAPLRSGQSRHQPQGLSDV